MTAAEIFPGLPRNFFACIAADAGTRFETRSQKGETGRSPQKKYTTMTLIELAALPVIDLAAKNSFLFFWTTGPLLAIGAHIPIMRAWGFKPSGMAFDWLKVRNGATELCDESFHFGGGYTTRKNAEYVVLGRRGNPRRMSAKVRALILAPRREHSRKPDEFFDRVEEFCGGPRLELFSRQSRIGWTCWGDQAGKFDGPYDDRPNAVIMQAPIVGRP